ncbi:hypothetical protein GCM10022221_67700 [Actinocorallia aurea]
MGRKSSSRDGEWGPIRAIAAAAGVGLIFLFTPDDQMVTWTGDYLQSDRPLLVKTPVSLVADAS